MNCKLLQNLKTRNLMFYRNCIFGKQCRQKFKAGSHVSKGVLDYIHYDLWGPSPTISYGGEKYYVLFVDDFKSFVYTALLCIIMYIWNSKSFQGCFSGNEGKEDRKPL